ncbi:hypothetical protein ABT095_17685 [Kitasatospora sp. NPDC002227]|uniref:hypothetical protein n=1 Tax=Kitasatospora sp. NPDC002227 TaxID=3154773 RepID=UPI00332B7640
MASPGTTRSRRARRAVGRVLCTAVLLLLAAVAGRAALDLGPASEVGSGRGTPGTYRVTGHHCGLGCSVSGTFTARGRTDPGAVGVALRSDDAFEVGEEVEAVMVDGRVYPLDGGGAWFGDMVALLLALPALLLWLWLVVLRPRRRRRGLVWEVLWESRAAGA